MKQVWQKILCLALVVGMMVCFAACNDSSDTSSSTDSTPPSSDTSKNPDSEYLDEDGNYVPKIGVLEKYQGETFSILVVGEDQTTYQSDDFTTAPGSGGIDYGNRYYEVVKQRNDLIEEKYGVKLEVFKENGAANLGSQDALAGTQQYDAMILSVSNVKDMAQTDLLCDLNKISTFDANAPWWDSNANAAYSIGNKLYFSTGDITIMNKANTWSMLFNKDMIRDNNLESPYTLFENGTWTFDKMCEMARTASTATVTSDWADTSVKYGMVSAYGDISMFYGGSGVAICDKTTGDMPTLAYGNSVSVSTTVHILEALNDADWNIYAQECTGGGNVWDESFKIFYTGRALFRPSGFTATVKLRKLAEMEFGIVPMPKINETQDEYWTVSTGSFVACIAKSCRDKEFSAYMLDACAAAAKNLITEEYIEVTLKANSARDTESMKSVEYIFEHVLYDVGMTYNFGKINAMFQTLAQNKSTDVMSAFDTIKDVVLGDIEDTIDHYAENTD